MYNNMMLVNCSNCRTPLQLPPGAESIRCALCQAVTLIADPRALHSAPSFHAPTPPWPYGHHAPPPPSPYNHAPPGPPPNVHGRKKAVICGMSYKYPRHELKGCINDTKCMKYLLMNKFKFPEDSIVMLTGSTRFTVRNLSCSRHYSVPYWVPTNPSPRRPQAAPKRSSRAAPSSTPKKSKAKSRNSSTNTNVKAKSSSSSTNDNLKPESSSSSTNNSNLRAKSSHSSTNNGKLSTPDPSQTKINEEEKFKYDQDTEDENSEDQKTKDNVPKDDQKQPSIIVNGNHVSGNTGDRNGGFSVGNTTHKHTFTACKFVVNVHWHGNV